MMISTNYATFRRIVCNTLPCCPRYATKLYQSSLVPMSAYDAFLSMEVNDLGCFVLSVCTANLKSNVARVYQVELTESVLLQHMENDIELCDDNGIAGSFGTDFVIALRKQIFYDTSVISDSDAPSFFSLRMTYLIGDIRADTILLIPILQDGLDISIYKLLIPVELLSKETIATDITKQLHQDHAVTATSEETDNSHIAGAGDKRSQVSSSVSYVSQPAPAKRRKGGGVKLLGRK